MISQSNTIIASTALGVAYIGYWMWKQIQKYDRSYLKDKVVVITGASSGVGEGNVVLNKNENYLPAIISLHYLWMMMMINVLQPLLCTW